jgi:hypothetical protein
MDLNERLLQESKERAQRNREINDKLKQNAYYILIFVVTLIALAVVPFFESALTGELTLPETVFGWITYAVSKLLVATLNMMIFHSFMQQAKINVAKDARFMEANAIMMKHKRAIYIPRSPKRWVRAQYTKKGMTVFVGTLAALVTIGEMILRFNLATFVTTCVTVVMAIIFGVMQMLTAEDYWTGEYWDYAKNVEKEQNKKENNLEENQ